jgi:hypothetical protein
MHHFHDAVRIRFVLVQNHLYVDVKDSAKKRVSMLLGVFFIL